MAKRKPCKPKPKDAELTDLLGRLAALQTPKKRIQRINPTQILCPIHVK